MSINDLLWYEHRPSGQEEWRLTSHIFLCNEKDKGKKKNGPRKGDGILDPILFYLVMGRPNLEIQTRMDIRIQSQLRPAPVLHVHCCWKLLRNAGGWSAHLSRFNAYLICPLRLQISDSASIRQISHGVLLTCKASVSHHLQLGRLLRMVSWYFHFSLSISVFQAFIQILSIHAFQFISGLRYCIFLSQLWKNLATNRSTAQLKGLSSSPKLLPFWRCLHCERTSIHFIFFTTWFKISDFFFSFLYGVSESNVEQILHGLVGENSVFHQLFDFPEICFYVTLNKWIFLFVCSKGLVRSPITATLPQIGSRLYVTWGILWSFPEVS